jgi:hypothetical protein
MPIPPSRGHTHHRAEQQSAHDNIEIRSHGNRRHGEQRTGTQPIGAQDGRGYARDRHGNQAPGPPFKEQELNRQKNCRHRRSKRRGHTGSSSGYQERRPFCIGNVHPLGDQ